MVSCLAVMYHHIKDAEHPFPWVKGIGRQRFLAQLRKIQKTYRIVSLGEYVSYLHGGRGSFGSRVALLTFDDGLEEHYRVVFPILKRLGLPAAFFPISHSIAAGRLTPAHKNHFLLARFSIPDLRRLILAELPARFHRIEGNPGHRRSAAKRYRFDDADTAAFKFFINHRLPSSVRNRAISAVFRKAIGGETAIARKFYLSGSAIREMARAGYEFGSHSHRHIVLAHARPEIQERELRLSQRYLERLIGKPVTALSYPFGHMGEFNRTTIAIAKRLGYRCGLANIKRLNRGRVDPFVIARTDMVFL